MSSFNLTDRDLWTNGDWDVYEALGHFLQSSATGNPKKIIQSLLTFIETNKANMGGCPNIDPPTYWNAVQLTATVIKEYGINAVGDAIKTVTIGLVEDAVDAMDIVEDAVNEWWSDNK